MLDNGRKINPPTLPRDLSKYLDYLTIPAIGLSSRLHYGSFPKALIGRALDLGRLANVYQQTITLQYGV